MTDNHKPSIVVCMGSSCFSRGNGTIIGVIEEYLKENGYRDEIDVKLSGTLCQDSCSQGPNVMINNTLYPHIDSGVMIDLLKRFLPPK